MSFDDEGSQNYDDYDEDEDSAAEQDDDDSDANFTESDDEEVMSDISHINDYSEEIDQQDEESGEEVAPSYLSYHFFWYTAPTIIPLLNQGHSHRTYEQIFEDFGPPLLVCGHAHFRLSLDLCTHFLIYHTPIGFYFAR